MSSGRTILLERCLGSIRDQRHVQVDGSIQILTNARDVNREAAIRMAKQSHVLFLDEDCYLPHSNYLEDLINYIRKNPDVPYGGGLYLCDKRSGYKVKAYNELCNAWVLKGLKKEVDKSIRAQNLLGGCLWVNVEKVKKYSVTNPINWGGEDAFMLRNWQKNNLWGVLELSQSVIHSPVSNELKQIKHRARLHGQNRRKFNLETQSWNWKFMAHSLSHIKYWPLWVLHGYHLSAGALNQKFDQDHSKTMSLNKKRNLK